MANNSEEVKYSFQGDVRSLKQSTETAIKLLDDYQKVIKRAVSEGKFNASAKSTQTFNNTIAKTIKSIEKMAAKLKSVGDVQLPTGSESYLAFQSTLSTIAKQMSAVSGATKVTTKDLTQLKTELKNTQNTLTGAAPQVDKLVASEQRFQTTLTVVKTKAEQVRAKLDEVKTRTANTFEPITARVRTLGGFFDTVKNKIQSFKDRVSIAFSRVSALAGAVASAFRRTSSEADKGDGSSKRFAKALEVLKNGFSKVKAAAAKVGTILGSVAPKLAQLTTQAAKNALSMKNLQSSTGLVSKAFRTLVSIDIGRWLASAVTQSISYIENLNLFTVAMGDAVAEGTRFVGTMQELYGMDPSNLMRYAGNFYQLATAIDMPDAAATNLSLSMTKAANDISSLFNVDIESVFQDLSSGMQGMSRAVRKYGMDIRTTTLQQTALSLGITEQVESMSEANRQGLRFLTMMRQSSKASGDFARTIEAPANQLKIFKEQMTQFGRAIGNIFIGPLGTALQYINGFIMALRTMITFVTGAMGALAGATSALDTSSAEDEAAAIKGVGQAAADSAKKMKSLIAPFDELNVLQDSSSEGGAAGLSSEVMDPAIAQAIAGMEVSFENIRMKANEVRDTILSFLGFKVDLGQIISWDSATFQENFFTQLPQMAASLGARLAETVNRAVASVPWSSIGSVAGAGLNSAFTLAATFITSTNWTALGRNVAITVNDAIQQIDATNIGTLLAAKFTLALETLVGFLNALDMKSLAKSASDIAIGFFNSITDTIASINWLRLGEQVATFLSNVDWAGVATSVFETIGAAFGAAAEFLWGLIKDAWASVVGWWKDVAFEDGKFTIGGLLDGIVEVFKNIGTWIKDNIFKPFIDGFKQVFDIHSPSKVMKDMGLEIVQGLFDGISALADTVLQPFKDMWQKIKTWFNTTVKPVFTVKYWTDKFSAIKNGMKATFNGVISIVERAVNFIIRKINTLSWTVPDWVPFIGGSQWGFNFREVSIPRLATGGVVTSPTQTLIGEGKYSEAVIPLDDSPQMNDLIQKIADAVDDKPSGGGTPVDVRVFIGDKEWDAFTYQSAERGKKLTGAQPIKESRA